MKTKKAVITILLVDESIEESDEKLEKEILEEFLTHPPMIPWFKSVEKVEVTES